MKDSLIIEPSQAGQAAQGRKELRDEQLFARLIGAAVLLAVAVIVLPFVLDGSGTQREYEYAETLPAEPERPDTVESSFSSRPTPDAANSAIDAAGNGRVEIPAVSELPQPREVQVSVPAITSTADLKPSPGSGSLARTTAEYTDAVATAADGGQGRSNPVQNGSLNYVPLQPGWNIQVASFVRDSNAIKLINRLGGQNLPAYANQVVGSQRTLVRVLVGPFSNQIDALALQNNIDRDYRVESLIVRGR